MITLAEWVRWTTSSPNIQIGFYYEKQRSGANMQYRIKTVVRRLRDTSSSGSFGYKIIQDISLDGTLVESGHELKGTSPSVWSSNIEYTTGWFTVNNKTTGTTGLSMRIYSTGGSSRNQTWTYDLGVDPAYPNITSFSVSQRDETSVQFNYSVDSTCDWAWYAINDGGWQDLPGNNIVSGLSAGTGYNFKLKVRRQDSQLTSETGNVYQTTYSYPSIVSPIPNFKIGDEYAIWLNNPLSRQCEVRILDENNNQMSSGSSSDYMFGPGFNDATSIDNYYQSIPNSPSGNYKIRLIVNSLNRDTTVAGGTYSVKEAECLPTFSDFTYADVNATTLALTGNNQSVIPKYSNVTATVSVANKATAKNYATMSSYKFTCGDASDSASYSASSAVNMTINNISSENFTVQAIDSRGIPKLVTKTASTVVSYAELVKDTSSTLKRTTGVSEAVTLNLKGTIWNQSFGSVTNSIKSVTYKYRVLNSGDEYETGATTITPTVDENGKFTFNGAILGDTNEGFDIENSYEVVVTVTDELSSVSYTFVLAGGKPHIAYHKNGVSIMGAYIPENGGKLQIDGVNIENLLGGGGGLNIGSIIEFAGSNIPTGFLKCEGQSLSKNQYPDLFDVIGYTYGGSGNNFNLPNLKGRVPVGLDSSDTNFNALGKTYGNKTHTHTTGNHTLNFAELPTRTMIQGFYNSSSQITGRVCSGASGPNWIETNNVDCQDLSGGYGQAHNHGDTGSASSYQPSFATYFIIKAENTVPVPQTSEVTSTHQSSANNVYSCNYVNEKLDPFDTKSFGSSGYQKLPSGLIIQWGQKEVTRTSLEQTYTATFPTTFPNNCFNVVACLNDAGWGSNKMNEQVATATWSKSNVTFSIKAIDQYQEHTLSVRYFAIGN